MVTDNDIIHGGYHQESVKSAYMAYYRPILLQQLIDRIATLWNYNLLRCEMVCSFLKNH